MRQAKEWTGSQGQEEGQVRTPGGPSQAVGAGRIKEAVLSMENLLAQTTSCSFAWFK